MKTNKQIANLIAKKIFGWHLGAKEPNKVWWKDSAGKNTYISTTTDLEGDLWTGLSGYHWEPARNTTQAWLVVKQLAKGDFSDFIMTFEDGEWTVQILGRNHWFKISHGEATHKDIAKAICLASLQAIGVDT